MSFAGRIRWNRRAGPASNARLELPQLAAGYFAAVRELLRHDPPPPKLHKIRLWTKRLRYTLELFRPCYGPELDQRLEQLRIVQTMLGEVQDSVATRRHIARHIPASPQRRQVKRFLADRAEARAQAFREHWSKTFDTPEQQLWWTEFLARQARTPARG